MLADPGLWAARGLLLVGAVLATAPACFYVPPITTAPVDIDSPPFVLGFEPDMVVDLRTAPEVVFAVDAVYDFNDVEEIDWAVSLYLSPEAPFPSEVASGELRPREVQSFPDATEYEGPSTTLDACDTLANAKGPTGTIVTVDLVLTDRVPASQRQDGFEEFRIVYTWRLRFTGECPQ